MGPAMPTNNKRPAKPEKQFDDCWGRVCWGISFRISICIYKEVRSRERKTAIGPEYRLRCMGCHNIQDLVWGGTLLFVALVERGNRRWPVVQSRVLHTVSHSHILCAQSSSGAAHQGLGLGDILPGRRQTAVDVVGRQQYTYISALATSFTALISMISIISRSDSLISHGSSDREWR